MKIAFTSCMSTTVFPKQPVWDQIKLKNPDHLVLNGDSIYIDTPPYNVHPKNMSEDAFAQHVFSRYQDLLKQPQFSSLVKAVPTVAIWDDHDFLWNESFEEQALKKKNYKGLIRASRAMFNAYSQALDLKLIAGSFPDSYSYASLWRPDEPAPGYRFKDMGGGVALHLTDGRSERAKSALLGQKQRREIAAQMALLSPETIHLLASGSVVEAHKGDHWGSFEDYQWLLELARTYKIMVLSGDIHDNKFTAIELGYGKCLYEATSSGAAIRRLVTLLSPCQNFGLLEIAHGEVAVSLFSFGQLNIGAPRRVDQKTWKLLQ